MPLRTVIIDDEARARDLLRALLAAHPQVTVTGEADDVESGTRLLAAGGYDLVLLDIQLLGGNGFSLVPSVAVGARIIFVTAHDEYAVRAFEINALDYLLKPVSPARLAAALGRVEQAQAAEKANAAATTAPPPATHTNPPASSAAGALGPDDLVFLKTDIDTARFVRLGEISAILSSENYTQVLLVDGGRLLVRRTLAKWEEFLPTRHFMRVHRTAFVNVRTIVSLAPLDRHVLLVTVQGAAEPVRARRELLPEIEQRVRAR